MSEEEYAAADKRYWAAYEELVDVKRRAEDFPLAASLRAVAIHRAELEANQKKLGALLQMQAADPCPSAPHTPGSPYTRCQFYETEIPVTQRAIAENIESIGYYSHH